MAIKIQLEETKIPVTIGDLFFEVSLSDDGIKQYRNKLAAAYEEISRTDPEKSAQDELNGALDDLTDALRIAFDAALGDGAFEQLYEQTPSSLILAKYLTQFDKQLERELNDQSKAFKPSSSPHKSHRGMKRVK